MYVGQRLKRREDVRFLTGRGNFVDDVHFPDLTYLVFLRSPHASALIKRIDTGPAKTMPGVLRVLTIADWDAAGLGELTCVHPMNFSDGRPMNEVLRPPFARDRVCHVGDVVAAVVATTKAQAMDAAEAIIVEYEALSSISDTGHALDHDAQKRNCGSSHLMSAVALVPRGVSCRRLPPLCGWRVNLVIRSNGRRHGPRIS